MEEEIKNLEDELTNDTQNAVQQEESQEEQPQEEYNEAQGSDNNSKAEDNEAKVEDELAAMKDKWLRAVAEFENYRKRTLKEKAELILNGGEKTIVAMLPVIDDMERAIANGDKTDDPQVLREGMELIYNKIMKVLESLGVKKIDTQDTDFDTDQHEAVAMVPGMGEDKKGKVIDCVLTGYTLNDKVIRHAKVAVGQ